MPDLTKLAASSAEIVRAGAAEVLNAMTFLPARASFAKVCAVLRKTMRQNKDLEQRANSISATVALMQAWCNNALVETSALFVIIFWELAGAAGFEPAACGFGDRRSTN
jgi:hypothetical protein